MLAKSHMMHGLSISMQDHLSDFDVTITEACVHYTCPGHARVLKPSQSAIVEELKNEAANKSKTSGQKDAPQQFSTQVRVRRMVKRTIFSTQQGGDQVLL